MKKFFNQISKIWTNEVIRKKILRTLWLLAIYRFLVILPIPFANVDTILQSTEQTSWWLWFFLMLFWWSLENFSIVAVWLSPYINASIIMQLASIVFPKLEQLQELWEQGQKQIQQYTRYLTFPLAFIQSVGMVFFINSIIPWSIDTSSMSIILLASFVMSVGTMAVVLIWDYITEKWISNGVSILIFSSIVAGITWSIYSSIVSTTTAVDSFSLILFMIIIVGFLTVFSIFLLKSIKNIPIIYARQGKIEQSSSLPIPLNPVGMIPIIFAMAFATFPYLLSQIILKVWTNNQSIVNIAKWIDLNLNLYSWNNPSWYIIIVYFILIILFTFFYTIIQFNPDKIADNIQKRWWYIHSIRPWEETSKYINKILMHLCFWWGGWLAFLWIYSYLLYKFPLINQIALNIWNIPVVVTWSGIIIIVWVVQDIISKFQTDVLIEKYENNN